MSEQKEKMMLCPHCTNRSLMKIKASCEHYIVYGDPPYTDEDSYHWELLVCPNCDNPILQEYFRDANEMDVEEWPIHEKTLYPSTQINLNGLPEKVSKSYEAALKVRSVEYNAFAVLIGRTLDGICLDKGAEGDSLFDKLNDLRNKDILPGRLAEMAQGIRFLRNVGAHADFGEIHKSDVEILIDFTEAILEYIYRAPARLETLQNRLDSINRKNNNI